MRVVAHLARGRQYRAQQRARTAASACRHMQIEAARQVYNKARLEMPTVRVVLKKPGQGEEHKIYHEVEAHISTNNVLHITRGGGDAIAEFQADAYLYLGIYGRLRRAAREVGGGYMEVVHMAGDGYGHAETHCLVRIQSVTDSLSSPSTALL